ncbi:MAG TPA: isochorismatase family protein [Candidatus Udaeobacter sp.]|nr:isochorismatase family protein [Candidatus Udaeobacter sp.]
MIDLASTSVLAIDFQDEYRAQGAWPVAGYDAILHRARAVIQAARAAGLPVIHVQAWSAGNDAYCGLVREHTPDEFLFGVAGSPGAIIASEVAPVAGEAVIRKTFPSGFRGTDLADTLSRRGVKQILALGVWTESCLRETVLDAVYHGFRVWLVKDACGSGTETMHRAGILDLANRLYGGGVLTAENAVKCLQGSAYEAWEFSRPVEFPYELETLAALYEAL